MSVQLKGSGTIGGLDEGLVVSGIVTSSTQINVGSNIKIGNAGVVTATSFVGSGANLTGLVSVANQADNILITCTGTSNALNAETNLTYNGTKLTLTGNSAAPVVEFINTSGNANEGDVLKLRASGRGSGIDDTDIFLMTNNSDTRTFGVSNAGTVNTTGNIIMASGKGISFAATSDASGMSNELLDDYEEGSWTPTILGWDTFTHYSGSSYYGGWYVKVGGMVHCGWKIYYQNLSTPSSNAHIRISGLPYAAKTISAGPVCHVRFDIPDFSFSGYPVSYLAGNNSVLNFYKQVSGSNNISAINATSNYSNNWTMGTATYATN